MSSGSKIFMVQASQECSVLAFLNPNFSSSKKAKSNPCCSGRSLFSPSAVVIQLDRSSVDSDTLSPTWSSLIQDPQPNPIILKTTQYKNSFLQASSPSWLLMTLHTNCCSLFTAIPGKQREEKMWIFKPQDMEERSPPEVLYQKETAT